MPRKEVPLWVSIFCMMKAWLHPPPALVNTRVTCNTLLLLTFNTGRGLPAWALVVHANMFTFQPEWILTFIESASNGLSQTWPGITIFRPSLREHSPNNLEGQAGWPAPLDHSLRMIAIQRDGSVGYIVHNTKGLYQFDPQEDTTSQKHSSITTEQVIPISQLGFDISGCSLAPSGKSLLITSETKLFIIDVSSISKQPKVSAIYDLEKVCGGGAHMHFRDAALVSKSTIFVVGHLFAGGSQNEGMSLFKLTVDNDGQMSCHASTGGKGKPAGWTDGHPNDVIFTRPHAMTLMPGIGAISVTDIDNRAVRYVELVHKNEAYKLGRVSTLSYDEHLWLKMY
ncbi:unnamed protein product, partial [Heterosigma akashiwo]